MSVDVEDWFQVENLKAAIQRDSWNEREYRVERNTETLLSIFEATETRATFFCLGWVAERSPHLIGRIREAGHEIASHGFDHYLVYDQQPSAFRRDVERAKAVLEDVSGSEVTGYRAPSFSITDWALQILAETGHRYDSSVFPVTGHDRYATLALNEETRLGAAPIYRVALGSRNAPPYDREREAASATEIYELPIATLRTAGRVLPWGGGGYFRLIPYAIYEAGFARAVGQGRAGMFYLHPWEVDPDQPRVEGIKWSYRFRHYTNLDKTAPRLRRLCERFSFGTARELINRARS